MKILVTGGAGFIASHLVDAYLKEGHEVVVIDDLSTGREENLNKKARFYRLNIRNSRIEEVFQKERPSLVNHQAAQVDVRKSVADPVQDARINILGTINILQNSLKYKVKKFIFASSGGTVYGEQETFPASETHPLRPLSPYGISKLIGEYYLYCYRTLAGPDYAILRYANVYGPRQDPSGEAGVVAIFSKKMLEQKEVIINGDGEQSRDYVYVADVVEANILASREKGGVFNVGTGIETTVNEIFRETRSIIASSVKEVHGPAKEGEQRRSVLDGHKARETLGWSPRISLKEGLTKTVAYFRSKR